MRKKLQVFISSTFTDLRDERQVAVKSVLNTGHIPAGMELFTAGDESQKEIIKRWIDESDVYVLILGGRYGSIDKDTGKSYTHWEYDYAGEISKPRFAIVLSDSAIQNKIVKIGYKDATEQNNPQLLKNFREDLLGTKLISPVDDDKDIEISIFKSLREIENRNDLSGWVSGKDVPDVNGLLNENARLLKENAKYLLEIDKLKVKSSKTDLINGYEYDELIKILTDTKIVLPKEVDPDTKEISYLQLFKSVKNHYAVGISNAYGMNESAKLLFFKVAPTLMIYGLVDKVKSGKLEKIQTSKEGFKFLARLELDGIQDDKEEVDNKGNVTKAKPTIEKETATKRKLKEKEQSANLR
ncbi:hypothetical protein BC351_10425 [Paenibacillus ferrarius]|uniref:DUF4062 domain-containing protein n=1 Tax=Paenibacillus ferrarius TaxID=1469647 RepID=A0A1V4H8W0_9BACL|nr:DUF4062 domain-containing protein [Paenibacillus ferrarius]OPH47598.1 hypothetical protein BC351_10425 [Paenibacillus ferrarius]